MNVFKKRVTAVVLDTLDHTRESSLDAAIDFHADKMCREAMLEICHDLSDNVFQRDAMFIRLANDYFDTDAHRIIRQTLGIDWPDRATLDMAADKLGIKVEGGIEDVWYEEIISDGNMIWCEIEVKDYNFDDKRKARLGFVMTQQLKWQCVGLGDVKKALKRL